MAKFYRSLSDDLQQFIQQQQIFFTATAPSDGARINLSPKGYDSLRIQDATTVCYVDMPGSGNETANHVRDNGRLTLMWCSFADKPLILRAYCRGEIVDRTDPRFDSLLETLYPAFDPATIRQIVFGHIEAIQTSCGYAVPFFEYQGDRPLLVDWATTKVAQGRLEGYIVENSVRNDVKFPLASANESGVDAPEE